MVAAAAAAVARAAAEEDKAAAAFSNSSAGVKDGGGSKEQQDQLSAADAASGAVAPWTGSSEVVALHSNLHHGAAAAEQAAAKESDVAGSQPTEKVKGAAAGAGDRVPIWQRPTSGPRLSRQNSGLRAAQDQLRAAQAQQTDEELRRSALSYLESSPHSTLTPHTPLPRPFRTTSFAQFPSR